MECLASPIKDSLLRLIEQREFPASVTTKLGKINECEMGTSYALRITWGERTLSVFIKCFEDRVGNSASNGAIYFQNELLFYSDILNKFVNFEREKSGNVNSFSLSCVAKCLDSGGGKIGEGKHAFIILDNLEDFKALDVNKPLSIECARLVLQQLGKFHAFSLAMKDQQNAEFMKATSKLQETMFYPDTKGMHAQLFIYSIHDALKLAKQSLPKNSLYVARLSNFVFNICESMTGLLYNSDDAFNVITHGDLWSSNIMCKFDEESGSPVRAVFVDFQGCRYASPVHDLMFILLLGLDKDDREKFRDDLTRCYHHSLCAKLEELGSDPLRVFPYSALKDELIKHGRYALAMGLAGLPIFMDPESIPNGRNRNQEYPDRSDYQSSENDDLQTYVREVHAKKSMKCRNKMLEILMDAVDCGYL